MTATIQKWGNSLALRLPSAVAAQIHVTQGDAVVLEVETGTLRIRAAKPSYRLADLVRRINKKNSHPLTDWGEPAGKEIW